MKPNYPSLIKFETVRFLPILLPKKYDDPRTTINYWLKKFSALVQQNTGMNNLNEIKNRKYPHQKLIHYSDRGLQYCNPKYTEFAENNNIMLNMTEQYKPDENAIAERIDRTLKYEYGLKKIIKNTQIAQKMASQAVCIYNNLRTHYSLDLRKPCEVHLNLNIKYKSYRKNNVNLEALTN